MRHRVALMLAVVMMSACFWSDSVENVDAYGDAVHSNATMQAVKQSDFENYARSYLGFPKGKDEVILDAQHIPYGYGYKAEEWISMGGYLEDGGKTDSPLSTRAFNHFYDPLRPWSDAGLNSLFNLVYWYYYGADKPESALVWALQPGGQVFTENTTGDWSWRRARDELYAALTGLSTEYRSEYFANCFRSLGQVMHLVEDMSVPLHTRNDPHIFPLDLQKRYWGNWTYETYTQENVDNLSYTAHRPNPALLTDSNPEAGYAGGNGGGIAYEWDVYRHDLYNIYLRTSPVGDLKYPSPTPGEHHHYVQHLPAATLNRSMYVISDEKFNFSVLAHMSKTDASDPWRHSYVSYARVQPSIRNQIEWNGKEWIRYMPTFYTFRGEQFWGGISIVNRPYPDPGNLNACSSGDLN